MNFTLEIKNVQSIREIPGYWTTDDYIKLLEELDYPDANEAAASELRELLEMAISDAEPHESAAILLRYKLGDVLRDGQIRNLSHEMAADNEAEENSDIALHYPLFNVNQLLHAAYNGVFPDGRATEIEMTLRLRAEAAVPVTKALALTAISQGLDDRNLIRRLFKDQLDGVAPFPDADNIIWELHQTGPDTYTVITSDYWLNKEDIRVYELAGSIKVFEGHQA